MLSMSTKSEPFLVNRVKRTANKSKQNMYQIKLLTKNILRHLMATGVMSSGLADLGDGVCVLTRRGMTPLRFPYKVYAGVLERKVKVFVEPIQWDQCGSTLIMGHLAS